MNYPTIEAKEYAQRVETIRAKMHEQGIDILVGFSNLLEIGIVSVMSPTISIYSVNTGGFSVFCGASACDYGKVTESALLCRFTQKFLTRAGARQSTRFQSCNFCNF